MLYVRSLGVGLVLGLGGGLLGGLDSVLKHYILRAFLADGNVLPWRIAPFCEAMTTRLLLERDGGIYRFRHLLLRDFVASLTDEEITALTSVDKGSTMH